jgi:carboxypeptidase PM20D1
MSINIHFVKNIIASLALVTMGLTATYGESPIDNSEQVARTILADTIAMRTVEGHKMVPTMATYLVDKFKSAGFDDKDIQIIPHGNTAMLVVRYRGNGLSGKKPILFSAHMDVVEAIPEDWERDPYTLIEEDGYFFGRGIADNKFGIAVLTSTFMRLKSEGYMPSRDLIIGFSGDEETLMETAEALSTTYRDLIDAEFAFVADGGGGLLAEGDGTAISFTVDIGEKMYVSYDVTAKNPGGHSSLPRKDNAIYDLARALLKIDDYSFPVIQSELTKSYFAQSASFFKGEEGAAMTAFSKDPTDQEAIKILRSKPEHAALMGTNCVSTMLRGGHAENALPQSATATINCRVFPGVGSEATLNTLKAVVANDALEWKVIYKPIESDASPMRKDVLGALTNAVRAQHPNLPIIAHMSTGATDALYFRAVGIPSYTFSGIFQKASDEFSHGLNERVATKNLPNALKMWDSVIRELSQ